VSHVTGLPGSMPSTFWDHLFWAGVVTVGSIYRRLVRPYRRPPLCFALLADASMDPGFKRRLASFLLNMPRCCLDEAFTGPLRKFVTCEDDLLLPTALGYRIMQASFCSKNHNIQIEDNFARASSWMRTNRGRTDRSFNLIAKHLLAEVKHNHRQSHTRHAQAASVITSSSDSAGADGALGNDEGLDLETIMIMYVIVT